MMKIEVTSNFPEAADATISDLKMALNASGEMVMTISKRDFVPVQTELLQGSGFVEEAEQQGDMVVTTLGYGGAAREYAVAVHEAPPAGPGQEPCLSKPLYMLSGDIPVWMSKLMSAAIQRRKSPT